MLTRTASTPVLLTDHAATVLDTHRMTVGSGGRGCGEGRAWSVPRCLQRGGSWVVVVVLHLTPRHEVADGKVSAATVPPPSGRPDCMPGTHTRHVESAHGR